MRVSFCQSWTQACAAPVRHASDGTALVCVTIRRQAFRYGGVREFIEMLVDDANR